MGILSIQSHVVYGYVGNKSAVYPMQSMGFDVWPLNTVQFSTHTGYKNWQGDVFAKEHIRKVIAALEDLGISQECEAIISGYIGNEETCYEVLDIVKRFKAKNPRIKYLCDPVMGNDVSCFVKPEVVEFFKKNLDADIITPNQFEAELLSNIQIKCIKDLRKIADFFHNMGILILVITGINTIDVLYGASCVFVSDGTNQHIIPTKNYKYEYPINGKGDLFSSVFLGALLTIRRSLDSAKNAVYYTDLVVKNTIQSKKRELQILSTRYSASIMNNIESIDINGLLQ